MARYSWGAAMHQEKFNSAVIVPHACSRSGDAAHRDLSVVVPGLSFHSTLETNVNQTFHFLGSI